MFRFRVQGFSFRSLGFRGFNDGKRFFHVRVL